MSLNSKSSLPKEIRETLNMFSASEELDSREKLHYVQCRRYFQAQGFKPDILREMLDTKIIPTMRKDIGKAHDQKAVENEEKNIEKAFKLAIKDHQDEQKKPGAWKTA